MLTLKILIDGSGVPQRQRIDVNDDELPKTNDADTQEAPGIAKLFNEDPRPRGIAVS